MNQEEIEQKIRTLELYFEGKNIDFDKKDILNIACLSDNIDLIKKAISKSKNKIINHSTDGSFHIENIAKSQYFDDNQKMQIISMIFDARGHINDENITKIMVNIYKNVPIVRYIFVNHHFLKETFEKVTVLYVKNDDLESMKIMHKICVERGADEYAYFNISIMHSIRLFHTDITDYFLKYPEFFQDKYVVNYFIFAISFDNDKVVESLLNLGKKCRFGLYWSTYYNSPKCFNLFIFNCDTNLAPNGNTPLMLSIEKNHKDIYDRLVQISDINFIVAEKKSAFYQALNCDVDYYFNDLVSRPELQITKDNIIDSYHRHSKFQILTRRKEFTLEYFCKNIVLALIGTYRKKCFKNCLKNGHINVNVKNRNGNPLLFQCIRDYRYFNQRKYFIEKICEKADFSVCDNDGNNAIMLAVIIGIKDIDILEILFKHCDEDHRNNYGKTISDIIIDYQFHSYYRLNISDIVDDNQFYNFYY